MTAIERRRTPPQRLSLMVTQNEFDTPPHNATLVAPPILDQVALSYAIFFTATSPDCRPCGQGVLVAVASWVRRPGNWGERYPNVVYTLQACYLKEYFINFWAFRNRLAWYLERWRSLPGHTIMSSMSRTHTDCYVREYFCYFLSI